MLKRCLNLGALNTWRTCFFLIGKETDFKSTWIGGARVFRAQTYAIIVEQQCTTHKYVYNGEQCITYPTTPRDRTHHSTGLIHWVTLKGLGIHRSTFGLPYPWRDLGFGDVWPSPQHPNPSARNVQLEPRTEPSPPEVMSRVPSLPIVLFLAWPISRSAWEMLSCRKQPPWWGRDQGAGTKPWCENDR